MTDGGFRADGTFVGLPLHDVTTLTKAFRRAVLRLFVRRELWMSRRPTACSPGRTRGFTCMMGCDALVGESRAHEPALQRTEHVRSACSD